MTTSIPQTPAPAPPPQRPATAVGSSLPLSSSSANSIPHAPPHPHPQRPTAAVSSAPLSASASAVSRIQIPSAVAANSLRLAAIADRLKLYFKADTRRQPADFINLCFALARGIDYALTNNNVPTIAHRLPSIIKQVYQHRKDTFLQSAITVLLISAKNACKNGWFDVADANELLMMANELCSSFCMEISVTTEEGNALDTISKIIPRFYPQLKLGRLIVSFEAKPGYDVLMADFQIPRNKPPEEKILLFVVQTDNLETSSCIISPPQVSFLVNGKGIERRTNVSLDTRPQFPTNITPLLKYGTNIIQAAGYFSGNYLTAIALVRKITSLNTATLKDYVQPIVAALASDSEIIEGPSRISLNCPISFKRIKTPVKGHLCKHQQCFDYDSFVQMNSRKPSWRCPCCNQPASFLDLCIDQNMVKILGEVGDDVGDVAIFADGSWKVVVEHNSTYQLYNGRPAGHKDGSMACQSDRFINTLTDAVDLTMEGDGNRDTPFGCANRSDNGTCETEDRKPFEDNQGFPVSQFLSEPQLGIFTTVTTHAAAYQIGGDIWPTVLSSTSASDGTLASARPDDCAARTLAPVLPDIGMNYVITDALSPAVNRVAMSSLENSQPTFSRQHASQIQHLVENMQLQQSQLGSPIISSGTERQPIPRHASRNPIAMQVFPMQTTAPSSSPRMRTEEPNSISVVPDGSFSTSYQTILQNGFNAVSGGMQMQEIPRTSDILVTQNRDHQDHQQILNPAVQPVAGLPAPNLISTRVASDQPRGYRASLQPHSDHLNPHSEPLNPRGHHTMSQPTNIIPQSYRVPSAQAQKTSESPICTAAGSLGDNRGQRFYAQLARLQAAAAAAVYSRTSIMASPSPNQMTDDILGFRAGDHSQTTAERSDSFPELPPDQNWRPTGRMRGSLTGSAYSAALSQYQVTPAQPAPARPSASSAAASTSDVVSVSIANNLNAHGPLGPLQ